MVEFSMETLSSPLMHLHLGLKILKGRGAWNFANNRPNTNSGLAGPLSDYPSLPLRREYAQSVPEANRLG
jgi:hypothetical protein